MLARSTTTPGCLVSFQLPSKVAREGMTLFPNCPENSPPVTKEWGYPCSHLEDHSSQTHRLVVIQVLYRMQTTALKQCPEIEKIPGNLLYLMFNVTFSYIISSS